MGLGSFREKSTKTRIETSNPCIEAHEQKSFREKSTKTRIETSPFRASSFAFQEGFREKSTKTRIETLW